MNNESVENLLELSPDLLELIIKSLVLDFKNDKAVVSLGLTCKFFSNFIFGDNLAKFAPYFYKLKNIPKKTWRKAGDLTPEEKELRGKLRADSSAEFTDLEQLRDTLCKYEKELKKLIREDQGYEYEGLLPFAESIKATYSVFNRKFYFSSNRFNLRMATLLALLLLGFMALTATFTDIERSNFHKANDIWISNPAYLTDCVDWVFLSRFRNFNPCISYSNQCFNEKCDIVTLEERCLPSGNYSLAPRETGYMTTDDFDYKKIENRLVTGRNVSDCLELASVTYKYQSKYAGWGTGLTITLLLLLGSCMWRVLSYSKASKDYEYKTTSMKNLIPEHITKLEELRKQFADDFKETEPSTISELELLLYTLYYNHNKNLGELYKECGKLIQVIDKTLNFLSLHRHQYSYTFHKLSYGRKDCFSTSVESFFRNYSNKKSQLEKKLNSETSDKKREEFTVEMEEEKVNERTPLQKSF